MARKTKAQIEQEQKEETLRWITIVILSALMVLGMMRSGPVGLFLFNLQRFIFGDFYWLVLFIIIIWTIMAVISAKRNGEADSNYTAIFLIIAGILLIITMNDTAVENTGFSVVDEYIKNAPMFFNGAVLQNVGGGVVGAFLYSFISMLFGRTGTTLCIVVFFIIAALLLVSLDVYKQFFANIAAFFTKPEGYDDEEEDEEEEVEPLNLWTMMDGLKERKVARFGDIHVDENEEEDTKTTILMLDDGKEYKVQKEEIHHTKDEIQKISADENTDTLNIMNINVPQIQPEEQEKTMDIPTQQNTVFINLDQLQDNVQREEWQQDYEEDEPFGDDGDEKEVVEEEEVKEGLYEEDSKEEELEEEIEDVKTVQSLPKVDRYNAPVDKPRRNKPYKLPSLNLLDTLPPRNLNSNNEMAALENGKLLIEILRNFDIEAELVDTHIGPSVTQYEIKPDASVKVSKILSLTDNIKMQLAARDIRIEAPIPGRNAVGIEVPNAESTPVKMKELVNKTKEKEKKQPLLFYVGKDLLGNTVTCALDKMPHLLIAGATGSGKSVCMNSIITSLLLRTKPDEVKMLLIDPKKVEFTPYQKIPHLIGPVINDASKAANALKVIVRIMDDRYDAFAKAGVRNISIYNEKVKAQNGQPNEDGSPAPKTMPYIVVIIDELADLMIVAGKEVEASIQRITQLARAAGIHLIVATQRPSTDVITGIIKANIPSRIAFSVSSGIDSRTILDRVGAERLLGNGDMLYCPIGQNSPSRVQGVFVTDEEVKRITDYCSKQMAPMYDDSFVLLDDIDSGDGFGGGHDGASADPLFEEVKEYVIDVQKASTSLLQRRFGIGYNRAARMIDILEQNGIIGPAQGSKPREVFAKKDD